MIRTQNSFDNLLHERAKHVAKRQAVSLAELCRRSVAEMIARDDTDKPWMRYVRTVDGNLDDSVRVDEVVYGRDAP